MLAYRPSVEFSHSFTHCVTKELQGCNYVLYIRLYRSSNRAFYKERILLNVRCDFGRRTNLADN